MSSPAAPFGPPRQPQAHPGEPQFRSAVPPTHALALRQRTGPGILVRILPGLGRHGLEERSLLSTPLWEKSPHYPAAGSSLGRGFSPRSCRSGGGAAGRSGEDLGGSGEDLGGSWSLRKKTREESLNTCLSPVIGAVRSNDRSARARGGSRVPAGCPRCRHRSCSCGGRGRTAALKARPTHR